ncbi:hypothetical protein BaRGS_00031150 [Batillaria attramentaria]|uniref:Sulfotransferase n=1 Tax=Batillaria attramentaria TaxID=370345 RepID=A0ABD0JSP1_9CAEN
MRLMFRKKMRKLRCPVAVLITVVILSAFLWKSRGMQRRPNHQTEPQRRPNYQTESQEEVRHIIFVKVHKAASSTAMSVILRFAMSRSLNVMLPRIRNILSNYSPKLLPIIEHPESPPFLFDILCNHVVLNATSLRPHFPADTKYVAIVREPLTLVQSAYHYFRDVEGFPYLKAVPSFKAYVSDPLKYEPKNPYMSLTRNRMSIELGLPPEQVSNVSYTRHFYRNWTKLFTWFSSPSGSRSPWCC